MTLDLDEEFIKDRKKAVKVRKLDAAVDKALRFMIELRERQHREERRNLVLRWCGDTTRSAEKRARRRLAARRPNTGVFRRQLPTG